MPQNSQLQDEHQRGRRLIRVQQRHQVVILDMTENVCFMRYLLFLLHLLIHKLNSNLDRKKTFLSEKTLTVKVQAKPHSKSFVKYPTITYSCHFFNLLLQHLVSNFRWRWTEERQWCRQWEEAKYIEKLKQIKNKIKQIVNSQSSRYLWSNLKL